MNAASSIAAKIGFEETGGDGVAGMCHHCKRGDRQHGPQQHEIIVAESLGPGGREGIADPGSARRVSIRAKADDLGEIVGGTGGGEPFEKRKIELGLGSGETPAQVQPRISFCGGGFRLAPQIGKGTVKHFLLVRVAAFKLNGLNGVEVAPPSVGVASPLRMQCPHPGEAAPQWYTRSDKAPAETVEQLSGGDAAQSLAYRPDLQFDDLPPERSVEAQ